MDIQGMLDSDQTPTVLANLSGNEVELKITHVFEDGAMLGTDLEDRDHVIQPQDLLKIYTD